MADDENPLSEDRELDEDSSDNPEREGGNDAAFWKVQIKQSKSQAKPHIDATDEAVREYLGTFSALNTVNKKDRWGEVRFPIFWSSIRTMQPALYSQTPTPVGERMLDDEDDNIARLGSVMVERLAKYLMRSTPFDRIEMMTCTTFLWSGKATNKICFYDESYDLAEGKEKTTKVYYALTVDPTGNQQLVDDRGEPLPDGIEVLEDEKGYYTEQSSEEYGRKYVSLEPVAYNDILHSPQARHWDEVDWLAFRLLLNKSDVKERFGKEVADTLSYSSTTDEVKEKNKKRDGSQAEAYAEVWEIWDRQRKEVLYVTDDYEDFLEDPKDDPYGLPGFYPCPPFMLGTVGPDDLYPVPDYIQLRPLILQLHAFAKRLKRLIKATQAVGVFDNTIDELGDLNLDAVDGDFIGVSNFAQIMNKGGLNQIVQFFPTDQIAKTVTLMFSAMQAYEQFYNDTYGIPDIIRGTSDPNETAAAQQMKGKYASLRFSFMQREFQRLVRDDIEIMCDIALASFEDHQLMEIMGYRFMEPEDQQNFNLALDLLRDPVERIVRVSIQTDSTITMNEDAEQAQRQQLATTIFSGLQSIAPALEATPALGSALCSVVMLLVRGERDGKDLEEKLEKAFNIMLQPPPPPPPPQPDPTKLAEIASNEKLAQLKIDAENRRETIRMMTENQQNSTENQLQQAQQQSDTQLAQAKLEMEGRFRNMEAEVKQLEVATQGRDQANQIAKDLKQMRLDYAQAQQEFNLKKAELMADVKKAKDENQVEKYYAALDTQKQMFEEKIQNISSAFEMTQLHLQQKDQTIQAMQGHLDRQQQEHQDLRSHVVSTMQQTKDLAAQAKQKQLEVSYRPQRGPTETPQKVTPKNKAKSEASFVRDPKTNEITHVMSGGKKLKVQRTTKGDISGLKEL